MNKRKRTAHRRAALWTTASARAIVGAFNDSGHVDGPLLDAWVPSRPMGEVVFASGVWHDDGGEFKRLFPDQWEELLNRHLDARRAGDIPGSEMLTVAPDRGAEAGAAVMRAARRRWEALGLVPKRADG